MGCSSSYSTSIKEVDPFHRNDSLKQIYLEITELIKMNPLYNVTFDEYESFLSKAINKKIKNQNIQNQNQNKDKENNNYSSLKDNTSTNDIKNLLIQSITSKYFEKEGLEPFLKFMFINVIEAAYKKFEELIPDNNEIIIDIFYFVYFFLSMNQIGKKKHFKQKLLLFFDKIRTKENEIKDNNIKNSTIKFINIDINNVIFGKNELKFKQSKFMFFLLNLVMFNNYCFIYFFVSIAVLDILYNFSKDDFMQMFCDTISEKEKKYMPEIVNKYLNEELFKFNENFRPTFFNSLVLKEILTKIGGVLEKNRNVRMNDDIWNLSYDEMEIITDSIVNTFDKNNFMELFFFGEEHSL